MADMVVPGARFWALIAKRAQRQWSSLKPRRGRKQVAAGRSLPPALPSGKGSAGALVRESEIGNWSLAGS
jgi:hypothetical protein